MNCSKEFTLMSFIQTTLKRTSPTTKQTAGQEQKLLSLLVLLYERDPPGRDVYDFSRSKKCVCYFFFFFFFRVITFHTQHIPPQAKEKKRVSKRAFIVRQQNVYTTHLSETLRTPAHARTWSSDIRSGEPPPPLFSVFPKCKNKENKN